MFGGLARLFELEFGVLPYAQVVFRPSTPVSWGGFLLDKIYSFSVLVQDGDAVKRSVEPVVVERETDLERIRYADFKRQPGWLVGYSHNCRG